LAAPIYIHQIAVCGRSITSSKLPLASLVYMHCAPDFTHKHGNILLASTLAHILLTFRGHKSFAVVLIIIIIARER
jgi:hypothetical protein